MNKEKDILRAKLDKDVEAFLSKGGEIHAVDHTFNKSFRENRFKNNARGVPTYQDKDLSRQRQGHVLGPVQMKRRDPTKIG